MSHLQPLISVIIPCYNSERFLSETLQSLIDQTHQNWEALCVDNGSDDRTIELISEWLEKDGRIRLLHQPVKGASHARKIGLENAQGSFIQFLDSDDLITPNKFERQIKYAIDNDVDVVVSDRIIKNESLEEVIEALTFEEVAAHPLKTAITQIIITGNPIYRKSVVDAIGGYTPELMMAQDWDFHVRLFLGDVKVGYLPGDYLISRSVGDSLSSNWQEVGEVTCELLKQLHPQIKAAGLDHDEAVLRKIVNCYFTSAVFTEDRAKMSDYIDQIEKWTGVLAPAKYLSGLNARLTKVLGLKNAIRIKRFAS